MCAASVEREQYQPNLYIANLGHTWFQLPLLGVIFLLPALNGGAISLQMTEMGAVTWAQFSLSYVCVCVCVYVWGGWWRWLWVGDGGGCSGVITRASPG